MTTQTESTPIRPAAQPTPATPTPAPERGLVGATQRQVEAAKPAEANQPQEIAMARQAVERARSAQAEYLRTAPSPQGAEALQDLGNRSYPPTVEQVRAIETALLQQNYVNGNTRGEAISAALIVNPGDGERYLQDVGVPAEEVARFTTLVQQTEDAYRQMDATVDADQLHIAAERVVFNRIMAENDQWRSTQRIAAEFATQQMFDAHPTTESPEALRDAIGSALGAEDTDRFQELVDEARAQGRANTPEELRQVQQQAMVEVLLESQELQVFDPQIASEGIVSAFADRAATEGQTREGYVLQNIRAVDTEMVAQEIIDPEMRAGAISVNVITQTTTPEQMADYATQLGVTITVDEINQRITAEMADVIGDPSFDPASPEAQQLILDTRRQIFSDLLVENNVVMDSLSIDAYVLVHAPTPDDAIRAQIGVKFDEYQTKVNDYMAAHPTEDRTKVRQDILREYLKTTREAEANAAQAAETTRLRERGGVAMQIVMMQMMREFPQLKTIQDFKQGAVAPDGPFHGELQKRMDVYVRGTDTLDQLQQKLADEKAHLTPEQQKQQEAALAIAKRVQEDHSQSHHEAPLEYLNLVQKAQELAGMREVDRIAGATPEEYAQIQADYAVRAQQLQELQREQSAADKKNPKYKTLQLEIAVLDRMLRYKAHADKLRGGSQKERDAHVRHTREAEIRYGKLVTDFNKMMVNKGITLSSDFYNDLIALPNKSEIMEQQIMGREKLFAHFKKKRKQGELLMWIIFAVLIGQGLQELPQ